MIINKKEVALEGREDNKFRSKKGRSWCHKWGKGKFLVWFRPLLEVEERQWDNRGFPTLRILREVIFILFSPSDAKSFLQKHQIMHELHLRQHEK